MENNFKKFAHDNVQPKKFVFDSINLNKAKEILKMYPKNYKESSIMPLLSSHNIKMMDGFQKKLLNMCLSS